MVRIHAKIKEGDTLKNVRNGEIATVLSVHKSPDGDSHADWVNARVSPGNNICGCRITLEDEGWYKR